METRNNNKNILVVTSFNIYINGLNVTQTPFPYIEQLTTNILILMGSQNFVANMQEIAWKLKSTKNY